MGEYRKTMADEWTPERLGIHEAFDRDAVFRLAAIVSKQLQEAVVVVSDEAAAMCSEKSPAMLPGAMPPFKTTLVDCAGDGFALTQDGSLKATRWATLFVTGMMPLSEFSGRMNADAVAVITGLVLWKMRGDWIGPIAVSYTVNKEGDPGPQMMMGGLTIGDRDAEYLQSIVMVLFIPAMFTLSMMNCKNVATVEQRPPPALSKRHAERHGRPLVRYYTLDIEPMRKVLKTEGRMDEVGLARALHLCRGHFKDYRESKGLFGKHKGLYWWDANVRGSIESGVVAKDYAIKPPSHDDE